MWKCCISYEKKCDFSWFSSLFHVSHEKKSLLLFMKYWLVNRFNRDPYNGSLYSPYTWVVCHPLYNPTKQGPFFHCSCWFTDPKIEPPCSPSSPWWPTWDDWRWRSPNVKHPRFFFFLKKRCHPLKAQGIPSLKLTYPLKIDPWKRRFLLETIIFRGYVSFGECKG